AAVGTNVSVRKQRGAARPGATPAQARARSLHALSDLGRVEGECDRMTAGAHPRSGALSMSIAALAELDSGSMAFTPSGPDDSYYDYRLEPYKPRRPFKDKYRSENLFWHALKCAGAHAALEPALRAVQASLGPDLTVWGVKWDGARLWSEIYVYDPQKEDP